MESLQTRQPRRTACMSWRMHPRTGSRQQQTSCAGVCACVDEGHTPRPFFFKQSSSGCMRDKLLNGRLLTEISSCLT
eukprot:1156865-Pelagomonas_calceolata.AAC.14